MTNPLLAPSTLPFQLPDYATMTEAHVREALEVGMTEQLAALRAIAEDTAPPTLENVVHAWERSGATLDRTLSAFWVARSADTTPERDAIMAEFSPRLATHQDAILMDADLYAGQIAQAVMLAGEVDKTVGVGRPSGRAQIHDVLHRLLFELPQPEAAPTSSDLHLALEAIMEQSEAER